jgi:hypothetical protein
LLQLFGKCTNIGGKTIQIVCLHDGKLTVEPLASASKIEALYGHYANVGHLSSSWQHAANVRIAAISPGLIFG